MCVCIICVHVLHVHVRVLFVCFVCDLLASIRILQIAKATIEEFHVIGPSTTTDISYIQPAR